MTQQLTPMNREIETKNNLYQTFYSIGVDNDDIFSDNFFDNIKSNSLSPKIVSKYPPFSQTYNNLPDELIINHCFPSGFIIKKARNINQLEEDTFYFTLDNYPMNYIYNSQYRKIYYTCRIIYEKVSDIAEVKEKYAKITKGNIIQMPSELNDYYIPKALCIASLLHFPRESSKLLERLNKCKLEENTIPIEKILESIIFSIPIIPRGQFKVLFEIPGTPLQFSQSPPNQVPNDSSYLYILFDIFNIENIVNIFKCFLIEIPILFFSQSTSKLTSFIESLLTLMYPFRYKYPVISILPLISYSAIEIFPSFVFGINETFNDSFFTNNNIDIENKTIVIIDLDNERIKTMKIESKESSYLYLDDPITSEENDNVNLYETIDLPCHYKKKFISKLATYITKVRTKEMEPVNKDVFNKEIREIFFYFLISIMAEYARFLKLEKNNLYKFETKYHSKKKNSVNVDDLFDTNGFLLTIKNVDLMFYKRFFSTKLFLDFIIRKVYPKSNIDKLEIIFIDEKIIYKRNKKFFKSSTETPFLNAEEIKNFRQFVKLEKVKGFSNEEVIELINVDNILKAITYFQYFTIEEDPQSHQKSVNIKYPIFPKLLYDNNFFNKNYELFCIDNQRQTPNLLLQGEKEYSIYLINHKYQKVYTGTAYKLNFYEHSLKNLDVMSSYIELSWLLILGGSLWYCDKEEREARIDQLFDVIEKIENIQEDIFEYLFLILIRLGTDTQAMRIYEYMIEYEELNTYTSYALLCMKMSKDFKSPNKENNKQMQPSKKENEKISFRKRKMFISKKVIEENNNETEYFKFETMHRCDACSKEYELNLFEIGKLQRGAKKLNLPCPNCNKDIISSTLKLRVMMGNSEESQTDIFSLITPDEMWDFSLIMFLRNSEYKIDIEHLHINYSKLFYNYLLYFSLFKLPFDFIIPYEKDNK